MRYWTDVRERTRENEKWEQIIAWQTKLVVGQRFKESFVPIIYFPVPVVVPRFPLPAPRSPHPIPRFSNICYQGWGQDN